jgi:hypothetical protein
VRYEHRLRVTRAGTGSGTYDPETGTYTGPPDVVLYDGPADVQDAGEAVPRTATGQPVRDANATAFIPPSEREKLLAIEPDDVAQVFYPDSDRSADGKVAFVREFDESLTLRYP